MVPSAAATASLAACVTKACSSDKVSTALPSSADAVIRASTKARFSGVTPVMPRAAKSATVKACAGDVPAAVARMAATREARASILATVSTPLVVCAPITVLSRDCWAEPLAKPAAVVAPMAL